MNVKIVLVKILEYALIRELDMNARAGMALLDETVRIVSIVSFCTALEFPICCWLDNPSK